MPNFPYFDDMIYQFTITFYSDTECEKIINQTIIEATCQVNDNGIDMCCNKLAEARNITLNICQNQTNYICGAKDLTQDEVNPLTIFGFIFIFIIGALLIGLCVTCIRDILAKYERRDYISIGENL